MDMKDAINPLVRKQSLIAAVHPACRHCGAGGLWHCVPGINHGCYDPTREGQPVGPICPNCNKPRPDAIAKGEVWKREVRVWGMIAQSVKSHFSRR